MRITRRHLSRAANWTMLTLTVVWIVAVLVTLLVSACGRGDVVSGVVVPCVGYWLCAGLVRWLKDGPREHGDSQRG